MHRLHDLLVLLAGVLQPPEAPLVVEADAEAGHQGPPEHDGAPALGVQHAGEAGHDVTCAGLLLLAAHQSCHVSRVTRATHLARAQYQASPAPGGRVTQPTAATLAARTRPDTRRRITVI